MVRIKSMVRTNQITFGDYPSINWSARNRCYLHYLTKMRNFFDPGSYTHLSNSSWCIMFLSVEIAYFTKCDLLPTNPFFSFRYPQIFLKTSILHPDLNTTITQCTNLMQLRNFCRKNMCLMYSILRFIRGYISYDFTLWGMR